MPQPLAVVSSAHQRPFGNTGLRVPPIVFDAGALGNVRRVIPEQTRFEICGEWFRCVAPPVFVHVGGSPESAGTSLKFLGRALNRFDVLPEDVVINIGLPWHSPLESGHNPEVLLQRWGESCAALGSTYRPRLVSIDIAAGNMNVDALCAPLQLKVAGDVAGVGLVSRGWRDATNIGVSTAYDWQFFAGGLSIVDHSPEPPKALTRLAEHQLPIVAADVFAGDFLVGGNYYNGRTLNPHDASDQALLAWRKAFVALCHGHGVTPAHASVQFVLRQPGVVAVVLETSHPDAVVECARSVVAEMHDAFWAALVEEGLLDAWHR